MLKGDSPIFIQNEAEGEQREVTREYVKELLAANSGLLSTLSDMDSGLIHVTLTEYKGMSHALMFAWRMHQSAKAEKIQAEREKQRNSIPPHA